ncbi:MAG: CRTAC1 family protein [Chthonomonadales bacterium]
MRRLGLVVCLLAAASGCARNPQPPQREGSPIRFEDTTRQAGIHFERVNGAFGRKWMPETFGGGGAFVDYDNDGRPDLLLVNGDWWPGHGMKGPRPTLALYHNNGNGTFTDTTQAMGLKVSLQGMGVAVGDYDNDGWEDLYITAVGGNRLFHNQAGRRFEDVTASAGVADHGWSSSAAWVDYDCDGRLDLFVCHYVKWSPATDIFCGVRFKEYCQPQEYAGEASRLFRNEGNGRFKDVSRRAGVLGGLGKALGVCVADVNGDGFPDLIVADDLVPNRLYVNNGNGTFTEEASAAGIAVDDAGRAHSGMGVDAAFDTDGGLLAVAIGNFNLEGMDLWRGSGGLFRSVNRTAGVYDATYPYVTFGVLFADFDNDGYPDLFAANGHILDTVQLSNPGQTYPQPALVFRNLGDGTYRDVSRSAGPGVTAPMVGRGLAQADVDGDGRVDLLEIANTGSPRFLVNRTGGRNHWLEVRLVGRSANRDGYGSLVEVRAGTKTQRMFAGRAGSYLSCSDRTVHVGLGSAGRVDAVVVVWPGGRREVWGPYPADQRLVLVQGTGRPQEGVQGRTKPHRP